MLKVNWERLLQSGFGHIAGFVKWKAWSTDLISVWHLSQVNEPKRSSGLTSVVRVMVPEIASNEPMCSQRRERRGYSRSRFVMETRTRRSCWISSPCA